MRALCVRIHPATGIAHRQHHIGTWLDQGMCAGIGIVQFDVLRFDGQLSAAGHRVSCVHGQVHDDLFHLPGIDFHPSKRWVKAEDLGDVLADQAPQQLPDIRNDLVQVQHFGFQDLLSAEHEQLTGERSGPMSGFLDLFDPVPSEGVGEIKLTQHHVTVAVDHRQKIVEVVRDPAGQLSDALHLLGLAQLCLKALLFGDVAGNLGEPDDPSRSILDRRDGQGDMRFPSRLSVAEPFQSG